MQPILDLPLSAHQLEQPLRGGHPGGQAREAIADLVPGATSGQLRPAFHLEHLSRIGKGAVTSQQTTHGDSARILPPMSFGDGRSPAEIGGWCRRARAARLPRKQQGDLLAQLGLIVFGRPHIVTAGLDDLYDSACAALAWRLPSPPPRAGPGLASRMASDRNLIGLLPYLHLHEDYSLLRQIGRKPGERAFLCPAGMVPRSVLPSRQTWRLPLLPRL